MDEPITVAIEHGRPVGARNPRGHGFRQNSVPVTGHGFLTSSSDFHGHGFGTVKCNGLCPLPSLSDIDCVF